MLLFRIVCSDTQYVKTKLFGVWELDVQLFRPELSSLEKVQQPSSSCLRVLRSEGSSLVSFVLKELSSPGVCVLESLSGLCIESPQLLFICVSMLLFESLSHIWELGLQCLD